VNLETLLCKARGQTVQLEAGEHETNHTHTHTHIHTYTHTQASGFEESMKYKKLTNAQRSGLNQVRLLTLVKLALHHQRGALCPVIDFSELEVGGCLSKCPAGLKGCMLK
jgi:hypothetical protein